MAAAVNSTADASEDRVPLNQSGPKRIRIDLAHKACFSVWVILSEVMERDSRGDDDEDRVIVRALIQRARSLAGSGLELLGSDDREAIDRASVDVCYR